MEGSSEGPYDIENLCAPLLTSMSQTQENVLPLLSDPCCIYRVPKPLRCVNEKAYTPQVVSIGPLHHGKKDFEEMEVHKKRYLQYFLRRPGVTLEDCETKIRSKEAKLRSCYAHTIEWSIKDFVRIILVDAAFIIELLLRIENPTVLDSNDRIFYKPRLIKFIVPDMLLLENQLPFFILKDLFPTADQVPATKLSVLDHSYKFCMKSTTFCIKKGKWECPTSEVEHFVDLLRTLHIPTPKGKSKPLKTEGIPSVTQLHRAGVKFEERSDKNLFDICFNENQDGILKMPRLIMEDNTELVLRNLIAFEQCHCPPDSCFFSDYIFLMDHLVNTPEDVELLVKGKIVENLLGDNSEVSNLINSLGKGVVLQSEALYFAPLRKNLDAYYEKPWNKWKAELKQKYFETPWTTISVIVATFVIVLTITQTVWTFTH